MDAFTENAHKLLERVGAPRKSEWTEGDYSGNTELTWTIFENSLHIRYIATAKKGEDGFSVSVSTSFSVTELIYVIDIEPLAKFLFKLIQDCDYQFGKRFKLMKEGVIGPKANN